MLSKRKNGLILMKYEIVTLEEKIAVGVSSRTNNLSPDMGAVIGGLWNRFYNDGIYESVPCKKNGKAMGIYTDYAGDEKSDYTVLIACETTEAPKSGEYITRRIPAGRYAKFVVHGDAVKAVAEAWQKIWNMNLPRSFRYDFEEYQNSSMENAEIHIYVGLNDDRECKAESRCGLLCSECSYREQMSCAGCICIGKPFWGDVCPVKSCCEEKKHEHCGECADFPCSLLNGFAYDEKQGDNGKRIEQCRFWKK